MSVSSSGLPLLVGRFALALGASVLVACSSSPDAPAGGDGGTDAAADAGCQPYVASPRLDLTAPVESLRVDLIPRVFARSCAFSSCHGGTNNNHGILLTGDPSAIREALVATAMNAPSLKLVTPGDPASSFLMHKIDGDQCTLSAQCTGGGCGTSMPQASADLGAPLLDVELRDVVRRWIAQGAADN